MNQQTKTETSTAPLCFSNTQQFHYDSDNKGPYLQYAKFMTNSNRNNQYNNKTIAVLYLYYYSNRAMKQYKIVTM